MKKLFSLISITLLFLFSSCEKCQDCEASYELINGTTEVEMDAIAVLIGYNSFNDLFHSTDSINNLNTEYCEDALNEKQEFSLEEDFNIDGTNDIRYYFDCK